MPYRGKLYKKAIETSAHIALENAIKEYYKLHNKTLNNQSARSAKFTRKALEKIKKFAHMRKLELLDLYSNFTNDNNHKKCFSFIDTKNTKE